MKEKKHNQKLRFSFIMTVTLVLMVSSIIAAAVILSQLQKSRKNEFEPAKAQIAIGENDSTPKVTEKKELELEENLQEGTYTVDKKVVIKSSGNDEYVKAAVIPQWYDSEGRLCAGLGDISDFGKAQPPNAQTNTQQFVSTHNEYMVILTYDLAPDWSKYWYYDEKTGFYHYRNVLKKGETTQPLITGAEISSAVYGLSEGYELRLDVISESIQTSADADSIRAFGHSEVS